MNLRYPRQRRTLADNLVAWALPLWLLIFILDLQTQSDTPQDTFLNIVRLALYIPWVPAGVYVFGVHLRHFWRKHVRRQP